MSYITFKKKYENMLFYKYSLFATVSGKSVRLLLLKSRSVTFCGKDSNLALLKNNQYGT